MIRDIIDNTINEINRTQSKFENRIGKLESNLDKSFKIMKVDIGHLNT
jgi:hypothetical protein